MKTPLIALAVAVASTLIGCNKTASSALPAASDHEIKNAASGPPLPAQKTYNGPFGFAMGISGTELMEQFNLKPVPSDPNLFDGPAPKPLDSIQEYMVLTSPKAGACRIVGMSKVAVVNGSGDQLKAEADRLADLMQIKYGKYTEKVDYIGQDVYRRNSQYWMLGMKEDSVAYAYEWAPKKGAAPLPNQLQSIEISTAAPALDSGYVAVKYTFTNFTECQNERKASKAQSL